MKSKLSFIWIFSLFFLVFFIPEGESAARVGGDLNITGSIFSLRNGTFVTVNASTVNLINPYSGNAFKITQRGNTSASTSIGGAFNIDNSLNSGPAFVAFSSFASGATGDLFSFRTSNLAFDRHAMNVDYSGVESALFVNNKGTRTGAKNSAAEFISANNNFTTVEISGNETGHGTLKISHRYPGENDANAAALSIDLLGSGTAAQGIFVTSAGNTSGNLVSLNNRGIRPLYIDSYASLFMRFGANITTGSLNASTTNVTDLSVVNNIWVNGRKTCLDDGTNCQTSATGNPFNQSLNTTNFVIFQGLNVTNTTNTGSNPIMSINSGEGATNFLNFNNNFFMGKQVDVFGFHTYNPNEVLGMGTNGLLNVFTLNGGTGRATVTGRNTVFITTVNNTGNISLAQAERILFPVGNATHLSITSTVDPKKGFHFLGENNINVVINEINSYNFTPNELGAGNRNMTFDKWKDDKSCLDLNHTHNGTGCGGVAIPHDEFRPSRTFDTVYFNNNSRPLIIYGSIIQTVDLINDKAYITAYTGINNPPTTKVQTTGFYNVGAITVNRTDSFYFVVQPKQFYTLNRTTAGSGTVNLDVWNEVDL